MSTEAADSWFTTRNLLGLWVVALVVLAIGGYVAGGLSAAVGAALGVILFGLVGVLTAKIAST